jgi:CHAT domain-containing protein
MILSPVAGYIADAKRLVVITDGSLQSIPFSALPHPATKGDVLIDRYEIVLLPSATVIDRLRTQEPSRPKPSRQIAVVADPIFSTDDPRVNQAHGRRATSRVSRKIDLPRFTRLPYSGQEAESISALWPEDEVLTAVGYEANLEAVTENRLSGYRIIHFATHGMIDDDRPELSSIVLSLVDKDGRPENGLLRASDIKDLSLSADLVVLSACSTALGYEHRGEGLGNLTRSFMSAGVPRVVASLWSVDDRATAELMSHFYRSLLLKGSSPATALREAQLFLRHDPRWSAPVYWAGFVLQGDWRSIDLQVKYAEARSAIAAETESVNTSKSELPDPISE